MDNIGWFLIHCRPDGHTRTHRRYHRTSDLLHAKHLTVVEIGWHPNEYTYVDNGLYMCTRVYVYIKYVDVCIYIYMDVYINRYIWKRFVSVCLFVCIYTQPG